MKLKPTILVGIYGHAGAGKDTAAEYITDICAIDYSVIKSMATNLKRACAIIFSIDVENFSDPALKNVVDPRWGKSPRELAQYVGTEMFREHFGGDIWVKSLEESLDFCNLYSAQSALIIPDIRFQNEADWIISNGGFLLGITRPGADGKVGIKDHASEVPFTTAAYPKHQCAVIDNSLTLTTFHRDIKMFMHYAGIPRISYTDVEVDSDVDSNTE